MANAKINNRINNTTITVNAFNKSAGSSSYTGYFILSCNSGYYFENVTDTYVRVSNSTAYKVKYGNNNYNASFLQYKIETVDENNRCIAIRFESNQLITSSQIESVWLLSGNATPIIQPTEITVIQNLQNCNISGLPQTVYSNTVLNLSITAISGFKFDTAPTLTPNSGTALNFTLSSDYLTATLNVDLSTISGLTSITIAATAVELPPAGRVLTVTQNLQNCTISGLPSMVTDQSNLQLTLTAANGYQFNSVPYLDFGVTILDEDGNPTQTKNFTVATNKLTATLNINLSNCNLNWNDLCETLTINGIAASSSQTVPITRSLTNCTTNAPTTIDETFTTVNIICTANENYEFDTAPTIIFYDSNNVALHSFTFNVLSTKLSANVTFDVSQFNDFEDVESIVLTATAAAVAQVVDVQTNIQNAVLNGLPSDVYADSVLNLTVTANNGYEFATVPNVFMLDGDGNPQIEYFTLATDKLSGSITLDLGNYVDMQSGHVTITANATAVTPYVDKYGTINVYKVTTQNLSDFAALRFIKEKENPSDTSGYFQLIDLGDYVVSVKRFYCPITDVLTAYIKAGNYNTNIQAETPQNDNFVIDCGTVTIPNKNNSITDYQTEIKIFLPFVGFVSMPSDYVGKTLTLKYKVNIITGDSLALLTCNGIELDFIQCTVSNDIIFKTNKENVFGGNTEFNLQVLKGLQPYAVIKYFTDENKQIYNADCKRVLLSEINGYFVVSELTNFTANITETENQMLVNELSNGVIILGF